MGGNIVQSVLLMMKSNKILRIFFKNQLLLFLQLPILLLPKLVNREVLAIEYLLKSTLKSCIENRVEPKQYPDS